MQLPGTYGVFMAPRSLRPTGAVRVSRGARDAHAHAPLVRRRFAVDVSFDIKALALPARAPTVGNGGDPIEASAWWCRAVIWSVIRYRRRSDERSKTVGRYYGSAGCAVCSTRIWCSSPRCWSWSVPTLVATAARTGALGQPVGRHGRETTRPWQPPNFPARRSLRPTTSIGEG